MRGADVEEESLLVLRHTAEYVPARHPLVAIRGSLNQALRDMDLLFESTQRSGSVFGACAHPSRRKT
jgi:hypothetical protein